MIRKHEDQDGPFPLTCFKKLLSGEGIVRLAARLRIKRSSAWGLGVNLQSGRKSQATLLDSDVSTSVLRCHSQTSSKDVDRNAKAAQGKYSSGDTWLKSALGKTIFLPRASWQKIIFVKCRPGQKSLAHAHTTRRCTRQMHVLCG